MEHCRLLATNRKLCELESQQTCFVPSFKGARSWISHGTSRNERSNHKGGESENTALNCPAGRVDRGLNHPTEFFLPCLQCFPWSSMWSCHAVRGMQLTVTTEYTEHTKKKQGWTGDGDLRSARGGSVKDRPQREGFCTKHAAPDVGTPIVQKPVLTGINPVAQLISGLVVCQNRNDASLNGAAGDFNGSIAMDIDIHFAANSKLRQIDAGFNREKCPRENATSLTSL